MAKKQRIPHKFLPWIAARKRYQLSNAHIQMARELGLSPKRFHVYADRKKQPWKKPLPEFIETEYEKQFGKPSPDVIQSIEEIAAAHVAKRAARKAEKALRADAGSDEEITPDEDATPATEISPDVAPTIDTEVTPGVEISPDVNLIGNEQVAPKVDPAKNTSTDEQAE